MMRTIRFILTFCLVLVLVIIAFPGNLLAAGGPANPGAFCPDVFGTGLNQPTPEQAQWMKENFPVIQKIRLNSLALERINADRKGKGLGQLSAAQMDLAPLGKEAVFGSAGDSGSQTSTSLATALPNSIDNSASLAFPPVRSQGSLGSCVAWSTTYYQFTYETNLALGRTASDGNNNNIFSPKWTYNFINGGANNGAYFSDSYNLEFKNGAASWADFPYDSNYLAWDMNSSHWNTALNFRTLQSGSIYNSNVDTMITNIKTQLANGHILVVGTYVNSWVQKTIANDPSTTADDAFAGKYIAGYETNTAQGAHGMTIVGYNDDIWCDLNGNGSVDNGEKGAFKIANSWGTGDWNAGYRWITYDSLRTVSAVPAFGTWPTNNRASGGIFFSDTVYTLTVSPAAYSPTVKAEVTLNQAKRGQVAVTLGLGSTSSTTPSTTWTSKAVYYTGGNYAFDGTSTGCDGTFLFDFSDLAKSASGTNRWFVGINDSTAGDITTVKSFKLYQGNTLVAAAVGLPISSDGSLVYTWVDYALNSYSQPPSAVIVASPTSGSAPLTVNFDGSQSTSPNGTITNYAWNFGDGGTGTGALVSHTYSVPGTYSAALTVTDNSGTGSAGVVINVTDPNILNAPTGLTAKVSQRNVTLSWTDNSANESGFYLERGVKTKNGINYAPLYTAPANLTGYTDTVPASGTYYYRVRAFNTNTGQTSAYSNSVSVRVR